MAPATPPPCLRSVFAALAIASTSSFVMSAWRTSISATAARVDDGPTGRDPRAWGLPACMGAADRHVEALVEDLRLRLLERRRAEAAAGRAEKELGTVVAELVDDHAAVLSESRRALIRELVLRETVGLGPLEELLSDSAVEEVMVNGPH